MSEKISIIIPVYNVEKYLRRCLNSIINQTYKDIEIILVDDGSTDNSGKICDEYKEKDNRIVVIHKENGGLSDARNAGIDIAKGKYIGFIDSDDFADIRMYEILYNNLKNTDSDLSICNLYQFSDEKEVYGTEDNEKITIYNKKEFFENMYNDPLNFVVAWNKLYKKEIFDNIRYPKGRVVEDSAVLHYIIDKCEKIVITNLELIYYFYRNDSILHNPKYNLIDELDFVYDRACYLKKNGYIEAYNKTIENYIDRFIFIHENFYDNNLKDNIYKKYKKIMKEFLKDYKYSSFKKKIKYKIFNTSLNFYYYMKKTFKYLDNTFSGFVNSVSNFLMRLKFQNYCKKNKEKNIIFNCPNHGNIGDHAILIAEKEILKDNNKNSFAVMSHNTKYFLEKLSGYINDNDIIYVTGGGNLGTLWEHEQLRVNEVIEKFKNNKIIIFPQTIYYSNDVHGIYAKNRDYNIYKNCKDIIIYCREELAYQRVLKDFKNINIKLSSDVVTYLDNYIKADGNRENKILFCFRNDKEKVDSDEINKACDIISNKFSDMKVENISTVLGISKLRYFYYTERAGKKEFKKLLNKISSSKLFVTDRLHGMIFATITNTPCIAFSNSSGKVEGVYKWLSKENNYIYFAKNNEELNKIIENLDINRKYKYSNKEIKELFKGEF